MADRKQSRALIALLCCLSLLIGAGLGFYVAVTRAVPASDPVPDPAPETPATVTSGDMEIHFLELGNGYTGDSTYIRVGNIDILIDAGSRADSVSTIADYLHAHMQDDLLDYVIVTHAHQDHYAGFATSASQDSLFDLFRVGTIIDFPKTNQAERGLYANYLRERGEEIAAGATHYTALEALAVNGGVFDLTGGVTMQILDSYYYTHQADGENNYSVCTLFTSGEEHFLFTGDLESAGEKQLVALNDLPQVRLYKAGHHGSKTSSTEALLSVIRPEIVCVCCCAGSPEYTTTDANQFPTQAFIDRVAPYTDRVYVTTLATGLSADGKQWAYTSFNGNICIVVTGSQVTVVCSASQTLLKDTEWFRAHRTTPAAWK